MKTKQVIDLLKSKHVRKSKGAFIYWNSYFYGFNSTPDKLVEKIKSTFPKAKILDSGNHWHQFVGGAKSGTSKDSYLWVRFLPE